MKTLTAISVKDKRSGAYTAFIEQFPTVVVQAVKEDELSGLLKTAFDSFKKRTKYLSEAVREVTEFEFQKHEL